MYIKRYWYIVISLVVLVAFVEKDVINLGDKPTYIPPTPQRDGNADAGYQYLIYGDFIKSGLPYNYYILGVGKDKANLLHRTGKSANVTYGFNVVKNNGVTVVVPTCLQCHAQELDGKLYVGLGNSMQDFSTISVGSSFFNSTAVKVIQTFTPNQYPAVQPIIQTMSTIAPLM